MNILIHMCVFILCCGFVCVCVFVFVFVPARVQLRKNNRRYNLVLYENDESRATFISLAYS
jgi:type IV secretory pathway VirB3-like protein